MRYLIIVLLLYCSLSGCSPKKENESEASQPSAVADSTTVETSNIYLVQIIPGSESTFGYDILKNGAPFIHQPHIPGMPGIKGFEKEEQARKAAEMMIDKLKKNIIPPTLSEEELMQILKN